MPPYSIQSATVDTLSSGLTIPAYLAQPAAEGSFPTVVVIQEVFGVNAHIRDVADRIAQEGYVAIAPHIYHRQAPGFEVGYEEADLVLGRQYKMGTQASELLSDIQGAIAYTRAHCGVTIPAVGCIGFCFGGHVAYLAATALPAIQATASFYGAGIMSSTPGSGEPTVSRTAAIQGTLYGFFGAEDPLIPMEEVDRLEAELQNHEIRHRIFRYEGAGHGFFCDRRYSYNAAAAEDAWEQVKTLFRRHLTLIS